MLTPVPASAASPASAPNPTSTGECPAVPPRFAFGQVAATPAALEAMEAAGVNAFDLLSRHGRGDWGDLSEDAKARNNAALVEGERLLSAYALPDSTAKIWILTEWDRSATTLLLPREY